MFGWFRKRSRHEAPAVEAVVEPMHGHADEAPRITAPQAHAPQSHTPQAHAPQPHAPQPHAASTRDANAVAHVSATDGTPDASTRSPAPESRTVDTVATAAPPAAPSLRPAMPLSDHPNFAGLGLAQPDSTPPRLLEPEAALSEVARDELTALLLDMFGPRGRYRLEWRPDRELGDDAMFSEIMVADLVRRIQNSVAAASDLELRAAPLRLAIEAMHARTSEDGDDTDAPAQAGDEHTDATADEQREQTADAPIVTTAPSFDTPSFDTEQRVSAASVVDHRSAAISEFLTPSETLEDLAASASPERRRSGRPLLDADTANLDDDRRIA